uniref:Uncharacterized protein n=1 Tax=Lynx canadensis TaxID=61383 RepID=A0A667HYY9_LYNCA
MGPRGAAAVAVGLWVLVTAGEAADPGVTTPRRCLLSHYRSLEPRAVAAVKALRDRYLLAAARRDVGTCVSTARAPRPLRLALRPRASPRGQSVPRTEKPAQTRFASSRCPPIRALVCGGRVTHGQSPRDPGFFAVFTSLLFPLQLELVRPGSWRKSLRPPRTRPQTRRAVSTAAGRRGVCLGGAVRG